VAKDVVAARVAAGRLDKTRYGRLAVPIFSLSLSLSKEVSRDMHEYDINSSKDENIKIRRYQEEIPIIRAAVSFNSFVTLSPFAQTTAIQPGDLLYRSFPYLDSNRIGETFMLNSKSSRYRIADLFGVNLYMSPVALVCEAKNEERYFPTDKIIKLPKPLPIKMALEKAIMGRRSNREFAGVSIPLEKIASILYYGDGVSGKLPLESVSSEFLKPFDVKLRTAASAGGLYPLDIYLISMNIKGLSRGGVYLYSPVQNVLVLLREEQVDKEFIDKISSAFMSARDVINIDNANFVIVIAGKIWKLIRKYGNRGIKYMFIESGEIAQNIHLSAQSLGVGTVDVAGYYDSEIENIVGIDGINEYVMHTIIGGVV
jgi:SagB-type dehydrogenase family enzyme